jgi:hypothetical protein
VAKFIALSLLGVIAVMKIYEFANEKILRREREKIAAEMALQRLEDDKVITAALLQLKKNELSSLVTSCSSRIASYVDGLKPFAGFVVTTNSANSYRELATASTLEPIVKRTAELEKSIVAHDPLIRMNFHSATNHTVMETIDSFSGPKKRAVVYQCDLDRTLNVLVMREGRRVSD